MGRQSAREPVAPGSGPEAFRRASRATRTALTTVADVISSLRRLDANGR
ncbi:hypothetical protein [Streptomyces venetus]